MLQKVWPGHIDCGHSNWGSSKSNDNGKFEDVLCKNELLVMIVDRKLWKELVAPSNGFDVHQADMGDPRAASLPLHVPFLSPQKIKIPKLARCFVTQFTFLALYFG